jgi:succinate dehydrogenase / fumarate reductase iron-sulfur subunit
MSQIMRLRRRAGNDHHIVDRNNGERHESAFVTLVRQGGLLHEAELLPRSYGGDSWFGKFAPKAGLELLDSLPVITRALLRRKVTPKGALAPHKIPKDALKEVQSIFDRVEGKDERYELNLYISGYDEDTDGAKEPNVSAVSGGGQEDAMPSAPGPNPEGRTKE